MKKKTLLLLALGLAATVQAQNAPAAKPAQPAAQPAAAEATAPAAETAAPAPVAPEAAAAPADSAVAAAPEQAAPADSAAAAPQEVAATDSTAAPADSSVAQAAEPAEQAAPADSAAATPEQVAAADSSAAPAEAPKDSVVAETAIADSLNKAAAEAAATKKEPLNNLGDIIHGNAYNSVGNEAAASTIGGNVAFPHFMHGSKLVYFDVSAQQGVISFGNDWTYFLAFDNKDSLGLLTAGIAFGKFGVSIDYALGKSWKYTDHADKTSSTVKTTEVGSLVGANASMNLGAFDVLVSGHYATPDGNYIISDPNNETEQDAWAADGYVGLSYSGEAYYWTFGVLGMRNTSKLKTTTSQIKVIDGKNFMETTKTTLSDTLSNIAVIPAFSIGSAVLSSKDANVYLGLNTMVPVVMYDEIDDLVDKHNDVALILTPNILGEVQLSKYFMAFGGASYDWLAAEYCNHEINKEEEKYIETSTGMTTVELGARFTYGPAAMELSFTKKFLENPFGAFSETDGITSSLGAFIYF